MSAEKKTRKRKLNIGGYHPDLTVRQSYDIDWPAGSIFENEGRRIYDIIRKEKPKVLVEIGSYAGCSTAWIAQAVKDNGEGKFYSIDILASSHWLFKDKCKDLLPFVEIIHGDCFQVDVPENIDFLFEDGQHSPGFTRNVLRRFPAKTVVCHDYNHPRMVNTVRNDFDRFFGGPDENFFEPPTDCGLAIKFNAK